MDIGNRGPTLEAGIFAMRITNVGILGNAFYDVGLSFDPSFEYPRGSGNECLKSADLWVGALDEQGRGRVSGGPELEWRPTLDPTDRVRVGWRGQSGSRRGVDDDGDGKVDEEIFNGRDDDGDGRVDEDLGFPSDEVTAADYTDDQPAAIEYGYPNGERHAPLGLAVHQEAYAWALPGFDAVAGIQFQITNHGSRTLRQVYLGLIADLDSRGRDDPIGHLNDVVVYRSVQRSFSEGTQCVEVNGAPCLGGPGACFTSFRQTLPVVIDGARNSGLPAVAAVGFGHATDPLALLDNGVARAVARAPGRVSFRYSVFRKDLPPGQGGVPQLDQERYDALAGSFPASATGVAGDQVVMVACGPFATLLPGQSLDFAVALVAAPGADSLVTNLANAALLYHGAKYNMLPDSAGTGYTIGETGKNGHEVCIEPPPGVEFDYDPHCSAIFRSVFDLPEITVHYSHGQCVWTNADCDLCTGINGFETIQRWLDPGTVPPTPAYHIAPGNHQVRIAWDNRPEILLKAGVVGAGGYSFGGYRVYRLSDWRRESLLPPPEQWELIAAFGADTLNGQAPLAAVTDTTLAYDEIQYGQRHYPIGRYAIADTRVLNGFDYLYLVTTVAERSVKVGSGTRVERVESPLAAAIDSVVVPHESARSSASGVWVVPNPYRGSAGWDRPPVRGDPFGRHIDFLGLPRARSTIKIWTVAGDFVAQVDHDGTSGNGQASWDLISRNGQDIESGVYLFTVDSPLGHTIGRFVVIR